MPLEWGFAPGWLWVAELWKLNWVRVRVVLSIVDALGGDRCIGGNWSLWNLQKESWLLGHGLPSYRGSIFDHYNFKESLVYCRTDSFLTVLYVFFSNYLKQFSIAQKNNFRHLFPVSWVNCRTNQFSTVFLKKLGQWKVLLTTLIASEIELQSLKNIVVCYYYL